MTNQDASHFINLAASPNNFDCSELTREECVIEKYEKGHKDYTYYCPREDAILIC